MKDFLYFIIDADGNSFYVDDMGIVMKQATPKPLQFTPDGWQEKLVNYGRSDKYFGITRSFSIPLNFVMDGAKILRHIFYTFGTEYNCYLIILRLDPVTLQHKDFYKGEFELTRIVDNENTVTCNLLEGGLVKLINAYENTTYEIPLNDANSVLLLMDGINLENKYNYIIGDGTINRGFHTIGCFFGTEEGTGFNLVTGNSPFQDLAGFNLNTNDDRWIVKCVGASQQIRVSGLLKFKINNEIQSAEFYLQTNLGTVYNLAANQSYPPGEYTKAFDVTLSLTQNEKLFIFCHKTEGFGVAGRSISYLDGGFLSINYMSRFKTTTVRAAKPLSIFKELISQISNGLYGAESAFLQQYEGLLLTSGDGLRNVITQVVDANGVIVFKYPKIKTSLAQFFAAFNSILGLAMQIKESVAEIIKREQVYSSTTILEIGNVADLKVEVEKEYLFSGLKIGYPAADNKDINGKFEFNNTTEYKTPITRISKTLELISLYKTGMYDIEYNRIKYDGQATTDGDSDNAVFLIDSKKVLFTTGVDLWEINRPQYAIFTGLPDPPTAFNASITPARMLRNNGALIRSCLYKADAQKLTFQTTLKNENIVTQLIGGTVIKENASVDINTLASPLFVPIIFDFETAVDFNLPSLIESNPFGTISFKWNGEQFKGYIIEASIKPADNEKRQFKLLASTDNDFSKLIL